MLKGPMLPIRYSELIKKEVVNIYDGCCIGRVCDIDIDTLCGRVNALFVPKGKFSFKKRGYHFIKWEQVERIGGDTILVRLSKGDKQKDKDC